jgi:hypothetical protein
MKEYIEPVMPGARSSPTRERTLKRIVLLGIASGLCVLFLGLWYDLIANPKRVHRHNHSQIDIDIDDQEDALAPCPFGGKTLAPANYTVVRGLFRQDEPDFDGNGYDLLKDGFGLLDKSPDRWPNFTK